MEGKQRQQLLSLQSGSPEQSYGEYVYGGHLFTLMEITFLRYYDI